MDAHSRHILNMSEARLGELRREAAEYALSRAAGGSRFSCWARLRARLARRPRPVVDPVIPVPLPTNAPAADEGLRRSA